MHMKTCNHLAGLLVQVGMAVLRLQSILPKARVVYCSATGASEPRNLAYMTRLGLWGPGVPSFYDFQVHMLCLLYLQPQMNACHNQ